MEKIIDTKLLFVEFVDLINRKKINITKNGPAGLRKNTECIFYKFCLDMAAKNYWDNFSCEKCMFKDCVKPCNLPLSNLNFDIIGGFPLHWKLDR